VRELGTNRIGEALDFVEMTIRHWKSLE